MESVLVGTYTTGTGERNGVWRLQVEAGRIAGKEPVLEAEDPSYLLPVPGGLYYVNERLSGGEGAVGYARKSGNRYEQVWEQSSRGTNPCHLALSGDGRYLAIANYSSGDVLIGRLGEDGFTEEWVFPGRHGSVNAQRQEGPHAHFVVFLSPDRLLGSDLGADEIRCFRLAGSAWTEEAPIKLPAGCGPRHLIPEKDRMMVICELSCELMAISWEGGVLWHMPVSEAPGTAAALKTDGVRYITSQRGQDVIRIFSGDGRILETFAAGSREPRDILVLDGMILSACQAGGQVNVHLQGPEGYACTASTEIAQAVCLVREN